jgi:hypothetical protein
MPVILRLTAALLRNGMRVVEPDQSLAIRSVQRERVIDAVRFPGDRGTRVTMNLTQ